MGRDEVPAIRMSEEVRHDRRGQRADARPREVIQALQALRGCGGKADGTQTTRHHDRQDTGLAVGPTGGKLR